MAMCLTDYDDYLMVSANHFCHLIDVTPVSKMSSAVTDWAMEVVTGVLRAGKGSRPLQTKYTDLASPSSHDPVLTKGCFSSLIWFEILI